MPHAKIFPSIDVIPIVVPDAFPTAVVTTSIAVLMLVAVASCTKTTVASPAAIMPLSPLFVAL